MSRGPLPRPQLLALQGATGGTEGAKPVRVNDLGGARGQKTLSEASSDVAGEFGLDLVGEMIGAVCRNVFGGLLPAKKAPRQFDDFELPSSSSSYSDDT